MGNHYPVTKKLIGKNGYISCDQNINDNQHLYRLLDSLDSLALSEGGPGFNPMKSPIDRMTVSPDTCCVRGKVAG